MRNPGPPPIGWGSGFRRYMHKLGHRNMPGRKAVASSFERVHDAGRQVVNAKIAKAKNELLRVAITGDAWKSRGKKPRHFNCSFAEWVDRVWNIQEVCLGAKELPGHRNAELYARQLRKICEDYGLDHPSDSPKKTSVLKSSSTAICCVTDHAQTLRKGMAPVSYTHLTLPTKRIV